MKMSRLSTTLQLLVATTALPFVAIACCNPPANPDEVLQVEVTAPDPQDVSVAEPGQGENLCGATVVATSADGEEIPLAEEKVQAEDGSERCAYRATVDPNEIYTVSIVHPERELQGVIDYGVSNSSCSSRTDPAATDNFLTLSPFPEPRPTALAPPSSARPSSARQG
jgi:hypothetical protein